MDKWFETKLSEIGKFQVELSLLAATPETYYKITGIPSAYEKVINAIQHLKKDLEI